jgi:hypothetical protein
MEEVKQLVSCGTCQFRTLDGVCHRYPPTIMQPWMVAQVANTTQGVVLGRAPEGKILPQKMMAVWLNVFTEWWCGEWVLAEVGAVAVNEQQPGEHLVGLPTKVVPLSKERMQD